jgi:hypothetical protein
MKWGIIIGLLAMEVLAGAPSTVAPEKEVVTQVDGKAFGWIEAAAAGMDVEWTLYKIEVRERQETVQVAFRVPPPPGSNRFRGSPGGERNPNVVVTIRKSDGHVLERELQR